VIQTDPGISNKHPSRVSLTHRYTVDHCTPRSEFQLNDCHATPAYLDLQNQLAKARRRGDRALARTLRRQMVRLPSADPDDPGFRRLRYCRYADDHLLGFAGPKTEAEEIKQRLGAFLQDELKLELSQEKTLITHARTGAARFLGYEITVQHNDSKTTRRRRTVNGQVALRVPLDVIRSKSAPYLRRGKPAKQTALQNGSDYTIVALSGPPTGASSSTTCWPETSTGCTSFDGSWRHPCSRP